MKIYKDIDDFLIDKFPVDYQKNIKKKKSNLDMDLEEIYDDFHRKLNVILDKNKKLKTDDDYDDCALEIYKVVGPDTTIEKLNEGLKKFPESTILYNSRGLVNYYNKKYEDAVKDYSKVIELDTDNASGYNERACVYIKIEKYDEALADANKAIKLDSEKASYYDTRANIYKAKNEYEKALKDYNKAIKLDPEYDEHIFNRGDLYQKMGNLEKAKEDFEKAAKLAPDNAEYKKRLEEISR